jgi:hypothetical protein
MKVSTMFSGFAWGQQQHGQNMWSSDGPAELIGRLRHSHMARAFTAAVHTLNCSHMAQWSTRLLFAVFAADAVLACSANSS